MTRSTLILAAVAVTAPVLDLDTASAEETVFELDERVQRPSQLTIETTWLPVRVEGISGDEVTVRASITADEADGERMVIERDGDQVTIREERDRRSRGRTSEPEGFLVVGVPSGVELSVDTASGDILVTGTWTAAPITLSTASGEVRVEEKVRPTQLRVSSASGDARILGWADLLSFSSASGSLTVEQDQPISRLTADTASGDVTVHGSVAMAKVSTASGDVAIDRLLISAEVSAISGQVQVAFAEFGPSARVEIATVSGDQRIALPAGAAPSGSIETMGGEVKSVVPLRQSGASSGVLRADGGAGQLDLQSVSGDIELTSL